MTSLYRLTIATVIALASMVSPAQARSHLPQAVVVQVPTHTSTAKKSKVTIRVAGVPHVGKRFLVHGRAARESRVVLAARKPGTRHWMTIARPLTNGGGQWQARVRLGPGGWQLSARSQGKSAGTRALVTGRSHKAVLRRGADKLKSSQIASVSGNPDVSQTVVLHRTAQLPKVGDILVADPSHSAPQGLLGKVVSSDTSSLTAVIEPAALSEAYSTLKVSMASTLGQMTQADSSASAALASSPLRFKCHNAIGGGGALPTLTARVDMSGTQASFDMDLKRRYVSLLIVGHPTLEAGLSWEAALRAGCELRLSAPSIPLGPTGLTLDISSALEATLQSGGAVSLTGTAKARFAVGFTLFGSRITYAKGANLAVDWPRLSTSAQTTFELGLKDEVALMVAGRAGIFGDFGPVMDAGITLSGTESCLDVAGALGVGLGLKADLFVTDWKVDLAKAKVTLGRIYKKCVNETSASTLLDAINQARSTAHWCGTSRFDAQPPLTLQPQLSAAAQGWASELASGLQPDTHVSTDGRTPILRAEIAGYVPPSGTGVWENVAWGQSNAREAVAAWMASPTGHCTTIMRAIDYVGVGKSGDYWVADFKCPCEGVDSSDASPARSQAAPAPTQNVPAVQVLRGSRSHGESSSRPSGRSPLGGM